MSPVRARARELHAQHHADRPGKTCRDCVMAASWLIDGRERGHPRARRGDELSTAVSAADLVDTRHRGRIVQTPGHRGYLRSAQWTEDRRGVHVSTATGVATYLPGHRFLVWGP